MKREFALDKWGPKRVKVTYEWNLANAEIFLDGKKIGSFATKEDFKRGDTFTLPNGSTLSVRFGPVKGAPFTNGVHVLRNGLPLPGSAADPVPKWSWIFMIACAVIPVVSVGGALPAAIAGAGIGGTIAVVRARRWSTAMRAGACALIVVACWGAFGLVLASFGKFPTTMFMSSSPEKLLQEIEATYAKQGFRPENIRSMMDTFRQTCYKMERKECVDYLRDSLQKIKNAHYTD
jgi:hypothetical protein